MKGPGGNHSDKKGGWLLEVFTPHPQTPGQFNKILSPPRPFSLPEKWKRWQAERAYTNSPFSPTISSSPTLTSRPPKLHLL